MEIYLPLWNNKTTITTKRATSLRLHSAFTLFGLLLKITKLYILSPHHVKLQMFTGFILSFVELTPPPVNVFCFENKALHFSLNNSLCYDKVLLLYLYNQAFLSFSS